MVRNSPGKKKDPDPNGDDGEPKLPMMLAVLLDRAVLHGGIQSDAQLKEFLKEGRTKFKRSEGELLKLYSDRIKEGSGLDAETQLFQRARLSELLFHRSKEITDLSDALLLRRSLILQYSDGRGRNFNDHQYAYSPVAEIGQHLSSPDLLMKPLMLYGTAVLGSIQQSHIHISLLPLKCEMMVVQLIDILGYLYRNKDSEEVRKYEALVRVQSERSPKRPKTVDEICSIAQLRSDLADIMSAQMRQMLSYKTDPEFWRTTLGGSIPLWGLRFMAGYIERAQQFVENDWVWEQGSRVDRSMEWRDYSSQVEALFDARAWLVSSPRSASLLSESERETEVKALREIMPRADEVYSIWRNRMHEQQRAWWGNMQRSSRLGDAGVFNPDLRLDSYVDPRTLNVPF